MKTYLRILLALVLTITGAQPALADAVIFSGSDVKTLKPNIDLFGQSKILSGTVDPTSSATSAPVGSIYLNSTNGNVYRKLDSGSSTNWDLVGSGTAGINNLLVNSTWNAVSTSWTASGGTYARTTTAAQIASGAGAGSWDSSSASQTLTSSAVAIPAGAYGAGGVASCKFKAATGTATHKIQAYDGTNVLAETTITSDTSLYPRTSLNFPFPTSGNIQLRIISVASNEPALYIDDCYLGLAEGYNAAAISQATLWAKASWAPATNCEWSTTSASLANFSADTDCNNPTVVGYGSAAGTKIPGFTISSLPTGNYQILVTAVFAARDGSTNNFAAFRVTDGTNNSNACTHGHDATTQINANGCSFSYRNTSPLSNVTLQIQGLAGGAGGTPSAKISGSAATLTPYVLEISVYRFPDANENAINISDNRLPTITKYTSGSGTYTTPAGVSHIEILAVGGGGGGAEAGATAGNGAAGGNTTFGTSLITANGGGGSTGGSGGNGGGSGGTASVSSPAIGTAIDGGQGSGASLSGTSGNNNGGHGGSSCLGGAGGGGGGGGSAPSAKANSGSGGGGGGGATASIAAGGGGSGGCVRAIILNPASSYPYAVGASGAGGTGNAGADGGAGGTGYIEIREYYRANTFVVMNTLRGTATNDNAEAGYLGEYKSAGPTTINTLTSNTWTNVTSVSLEAGDWDVTGMTCTSVGGTATGNSGGVISNFSGTTTTDHSTGLNLWTSTAAAASGGNNCMGTTVRKSLSTTTTVYLKCLIVFSAGSVDCIGSIQARRVR